MRQRPFSHARVSAAVPTVRSGERKATAPEPGAGAPEQGLTERRGLGPKILAGAILAGILAFGFWVRLRNIGYGLPYVYNYDEAQHFTNHAVAMFHGDLNPGYFQNPSGFTYLVYVTLRLGYGILGLHLDSGSIVKQWAFDPTPIWEWARSLAAVLAMLGVVGTFLVGRRFWGTRVGLIAAALLTFAFLPVTYSRIAVTDVGTFLPVAVAVWGALRVYEDGRLRYYLATGAAIGFACGFKYTAGLVIVPLIIAAGVRYWRDRETPWLKRIDLRYLIAAGAMLVLAFAITTPFFFIHPVSALYQLKQQAQAAGDTAKLGQSQQGGFSYYLDSFTWGFGWAAIIAAVAGGVLEIRRDRVRGLMLVSFPIVLFLYMGAQTRYFGRWLLMMYPILAILAGIAVVRLTGLVRGRYAWAISGGLAALITAAILIQPIAADVRTSTVLGRQDTRQTARDWLVAHYPKGLRAVIEPAVPDNFYKVTGPNPQRQRQFVRGFVRDIRKQQQIDAPLGADTTYAATLTPDNIDSYRSQGFCLVMTNSLIRGRAENAAVPQALAYYERLVRESTLVFHDTPFKPGRAAVPLHYDFSYDYYPTAYERPGGIVDIYRLKNCREQYGRVPAQPYGTSGLQKGIGTSFPPN